MHAFYEISKKIIGFENESIIDNIHKINYIIFFQKEYSVQNKFIFLNGELNNMFNTHEIYEKKFDYFNKIQRIYHAFSRMAYIYKYKKAKIIIDTDLIMNPIDINSKCTFCLYQNNCKYLFNIHELIKIINNSIANSSHFFYNPIPVKNPYNNIIFNKSTLYNIYFFIKMNTLLSPEIFYYFFRTNFNMNKFVKEYQYLLRDFAIQTYLNNSSSETLRDDINCMIDEFNCIFLKIEKQIIVHHEFPNDKLIEIMRPYLRLYLLSHYSLIYVIREKSKKDLIKELSNFKKFNPLFGRKMMKIGNSSNSSTTTSFNMVNSLFYINETNKENKEFMINHAGKVTYEDNDEFNRYVYFVSEDEDEDEEETHDNAEEDLDNEPW
jgi:hypothetical protein